MINAKLISHREPAEVKNFDSRELEAPIIERIKALEPELTAGGSAIFYGTPMSSHTTFMIGGAADALIEANSPQTIQNVYKTARKYAIPVFMLGGGSNLLVNDGGIRGIVLKNSYKGLAVIDRNFHDVASLIYSGAAEEIQDPETVLVSAGTGTKLSEFVEFACSHGLSGAESFAGIPGTLGGAIFGNAGAYGKGVGDILVSAHVLDPESRIVGVDASHFGFSYRQSALKTSGEIVLAAVFRLKRGNGQAIREQVDKIIAERHKKHPPETIGSAGSYFKNIEPHESGHRRSAAGFFLEQAGVKGMRVGNAEVYSGHANFIINPGGAKADEVLALATKMKSMVLEKFGLLLEEEVRYVE